MDVSQFSVAFTLISKTKQPLEIYVWNLVRRMDVMTLGQSLRWYFLISNDR